MHPKSKNTALLVSALGIGSASVGIMGFDWDATLASIRGLIGLAHGAQPNSINAQMISMGTLTASIVLGAIRRIVMTILTTIALALGAFALMNLHP
jgi:hypothetical protein